MERFGPQLRASFESAGQQMVASGNPQAASVKPLMEGLLKLFEQTEMVHVSLDVPSSASLVIDVIPAANSNAAGVFARQPAARFDGLARHGGSTIAVAGRGDWASVQEVFEPLMRTFYQSEGEAGSAMRDFADTMWALIHGEMSMGLSFDKGRPSGSWHWGVKDPKVARQRLAAAYRKLAAAGKVPTDPYFEISARPRAFRHRGVVVASYTTALARNAPRDQVEMSKRLWGSTSVVSFQAIAGTSGLMTMGSGGKRAMKAEIDRSLAGDTKPAPIPADFAAAVATARARKESFLILMDLASVLASFAGTAAPSGTDPLAIGVGFAGNRLSLRLAVPVAQARQLAAQRSP